MNLKIFCGERTSSYFSFKLTTFTWHVKHDLIVLCCMKTTVILGFLSVWYVSTIYPKAIVWYGQPDPSKIIYFDTTVNCWNAPRGFTQEFYQTKSDVKHQKDSQSSSIAGKRNHLIFWLWTHSSQRKHCCFCFGTVVQR